MRFQFKFQYLSPSVVLVWLLEFNLLPTSLQGRLPAALAEEEEGRAEAIARLSQVFRLDKVPVLRHHRSPPQYMVDLYHDVADSDGITKSRSPYGSNVVRGFPDRGKKCTFYFRRNYSIC